MSEHYKPAGRLERPPKDISQMRREAAAAQRALNDADLQAMFNEMQEDAADAALFSGEAQVREESRIKVITVAELRGRLKLAAAYQEEQRQDDERATLFE